MCGITAYVGPRLCLPIVLDELKRLEYRGYDSAGVAAIEDGRVRVIKSVGKIKNLESLVDEANVQSTIGISHTRWATHGRPSTVNAHPHPDCKEEIAVVHNGIIENYMALKEWLISEGHRFRSETDTEVLAHLFEHFMKGNLEEAIREGLKKVHGSYAVAVVSSHFPEGIIVARKDSPLVVGVGEGEFYAASDIPALLPYTREVYLLEDGDMAVLTHDGVRLGRVNGSKVERSIYHVDWDLSAAEKGGYDHFMIKEIHEQPRTIRDTMRGRVTDDSKLNLSEIGLSAEQLNRFNRFYIVACGTAYHAGMVGKYFMEKHLRVPVEAALGSEFRYRDPIIDDKTLVIVVSQSGETADTLAALRDSKQKGATTLAVVNVVGSTIAREADHVLYTWAGPEICVASTKAYVTQLIALYLLGMHLATIKRTLSEPQIAEMVNAMRELPEKVEQHIAGQEEHIIEIARELCRHPAFFYLGRGMDWVTGMEGALKLKEIAYIYAEAFAAGELKHGPLALITGEVAVACVLTQSDLSDKMISNIKEVKAREGLILMVCREGDQNAASVADYMITIPSVTDAFMPVLAIIPLQLLAYYAAKELGCEIDQPRNLAKSVTVE
ncbi:MAG: glutamine--fructose-6-phosphate transaminase (isomerizing) [Armatimonadetes bacterium]|nr:glutamine--fructose-6-phosphate transaminase (isomerizing) [Armatimonadota bacterium]